MTPLTWLAKPLLILAVFIAVMVAFGEFVAHERKLGSDRKQTELNAQYQKGVDDAKAAADALHAQKLSAVEASHVQDLQLQAKQVDDGLAARSELDRLRAALAARPRPAAASSAPQAGPVADAGPDLGGLLGECSGRYETVAAAATDYAVQVTGLQGYIRGLFAGEPNQIEASVVTTAPPVGEGSRGANKGVLTQPTTELPEPIQVEAVPPIQGGAP